MIKVLTTLVKRRLIKITVVTDGKVTEQQIATLGAAATTRNKICDRLSQPGVEVEAPDPIPYPFDYDREGTAEQVRAADRVRTRASRNRGSK